jgi:micrococcal nuclease
MRRWLQWGCLGAAGLLALTTLFGLAVGLGEGRTPGAPAPTATAAPAMTAAPLRPTPTFAVVATPAPAITGDEALVVKVTDGDTIDVLLGDETLTVRYVGIDTPERGQPGYQAATEANRLLVGGQTVILVKGRSDTDRYGRLLRYVYLAGGTMVNAALVAEGWAQPVEYPPDTAYAAEFRQAAMDAALNRRGFWSGTSPYDGVMSYAYTTRDVELRAGPGADQAVSGAALRHTPLTVFGRDAAGDWVQARTPQRGGGWAPVADLVLNVPVESVPVANDP